MQRIEKRNKFQLDLIRKMLKEERKRRNLSLSEFAKLIGISKTSVWNYENGERIPTLEILSRMLSTMNISYDYIFDRWTKSREYQLIDNERINGHFRTIRQMANLGYNSELDHLMFIMKTFVEKQINDKKREAARIHKRKQLGELIEHKDKFDPSDRRDD